MQLIQSPGCETSCDQLIVVPEYSLGTIPMMNVPIHDQDSTQIAHVIIGE